MINIREIIKALRTLIRIKVFVSIGLVSIISALVLVIVVEGNKLNKIRDDLDGMLKKYGETLVSKVELHEKIQSLSEEKDKLEKEKEQMKRDEVAKVYLERLKSRIKGYYFYCGADKSEKDIELAINTTFESAKLLKEKGVIKRYGKTVKIIALRLLAEARLESNFTFVLVSQNYKRDKWGNFEMKDGRKSKQVGTDYFIIDKNNKLIKTAWSDLVKSLTPTSKDYGAWQVNECHLDACFKLLNKYGVWSPIMNKWCLDPQVNCMMRLLVNEDRIGRGWDDENLGHWDVNFLNMLLCVEGCPEQYEK